MPTITRMAATTHNRTPLILGSPFDSRAMASAQARTAVREEWHPAHTTSKYPTRFQTKRPRNNAAAVFGDDDPESQIVSYELLHAGMPNVRSERRSKWPTERARPARTRTGGTRLGRAVTTDRRAPGADRQRGRRTRV
jgi:hypothetical protein